MPAKTITESRMTMTANATKLVSVQNNSDIVFLIDEYSTIGYDDNEELLKDTIMSASSLTLNKETGTLYYTDLHGNTHHFTTVN